MKDPIDALMGPEAPGEEEEEGSESLPPTAPGGAPAPEAPEAPGAAPPDAQPPLPEEPPVPERPPQEVIDGIQASLDELRGAMAKLGM